MSDAGGILCGDLRLISAQPVRYNQSGLKQVQISGIGISAEERYAHRTPLSALQRYCTRITHIPEMWVNNRVLYTRLDVIGAIVFTSISALNVLIQSCTQHVLRILYVIHIIPAVLVGAADIVIRYMRYWFYRFMVVNSAIYSLVECEWS